MSDAVDLTWQTARGLEQGLDCGRLEQWQLGTSETQAVGTVGAPKKREPRAGVTMRLSERVDQSGEEALLRFTIAVP